MSTLSVEYSSVGRLDGKYLVPHLEEGVVAAMFSETLKNLQQKMLVEQESHLA
jgi:hypothetical protein